MPIPANLKRAKEQLPMLSHTYGHVDLLLPDSLCTIVPVEYCTADNARDLFLQNFPFTTAHQDVMQSPVIEGGYVLLYAVDKSVLKWANELFPHVKVQPSLQPVLTFFLKERSKAFVVNLHERKMDALYVDNGNLLYQNTFDNTSADDCLYFMLGIWNSLGLSQEDDHLLLAGHTPGMSEIRASLTRFIQHVEVLRPADVFHGSELARLSGVPFDIQCLVSM